MKAPVLIALALLSALPAAAEFVERNFVREVTPGRAFAVGTSLETIRADSLTAETVTYFDGLGREVLKVRRAAGGSGGDVGILSEYDHAGMLSRSWVPVPLPGADGAFVQPASVRDAAASFYGADVRPYTEYGYEDAATKRLSRQFMPGVRPSAAQGATHISYFPNDSSDERSCRLLKVDFDGAVCVAGHYRARTLGIARTTDPDGRVTMEFDDTQGRTVLTRRLTGEPGRPYADTYRVYDIYGNLRVVFSPEASAQLPESGSVPQSLLDGLCQQFRYDVSGRCIWAKAPGCEPELTVYSPFDQPLMVQRPDQRASNTWTVFKYDHLHRRVLEGTATTRMTHDELQELFADSLFIEHVVPGPGAMEYDLQYSNLAGPAGFKALRAWYYDNHSFATNVTVPSHPDFPFDPSLSALELPTGSAVIAGGTGRYTAVWYDDYDRPVAAVEWDPFGNGDRITELKTYDFRGNVLRRMVRAERMTEGTVLSSCEAHWRTTYDRADRPRTAEFSPDGSHWTLLGSYVYDEAGRPAGVDGVCQERYERNVRGQIASLSSGPFLRQRIFYEDSTDSLSRSLSGMPTYISEKGWGQENAFRIRYDGLGRLTDYSSVYGTVGERTEYDLNGNPTAIRRRYQSIDASDTDIAYTGNRISRVSEAGSDALAGKVPALTAGEYPDPVGYDAAGRPVRDDTRGITSIKYHSFGNFINRVDFSSGNRLTMTYLPDGRLTTRCYDRYRTTLTPRVDAKGDTTWRSVRKHESRDIHTYSGPFETHNGSTTVQTGFGHWSYSDSTHIWYARDAKGSVRNTVQLSASGTRQCANHTFTYPSGLPVRLGGARRTDRLHQDKEWIDADGTGWYDNAARIYDAVLLRFLTPDPLWRRYLDTAPYTYCLANPLRYLDRDGAQNRQLETMSVGQPMYGLQNVRVPNQLNGTCFVADSFQPVELPDRNAEIPDSEHEIQINAPQDEQIGQMLHAANVINTSLGVENGVKEAFIKYAVKGTETGREFGIYMKCLKHMGRITMFGGIAIAGCNAWNYYQMGGRSLLVYGKYLGDGAISYVGTMGWEGMIVSGVYLILDEATDGFWIDYSVPTQQNALTDD